MTSQTSAVSSSSPVSPASASGSSRDKRAVEHQLPVAAARKVEPRFDDNSENNSLVIANIGDSVALHCRIWMKQVDISDGSNFWFLVQIVMSLTCSFPTWLFSLWCHTQQEEPAIYYSSKEQFEQHGFWKYYIDM